MNDVTAAAILKTLERIASSMEYFENQARHPNGLSDAHNPRVQAIAFTRAVDVLQSRMSAFMSPEEIRLLKDGFGGWDEIVQSGVLTSSWFNWGDGQLSARLIAAATQRVQAKTANQTPVKPSPSAGHPGRRNRS